MRTLFVAGFLLGCKAPPSAPTELSELSRWLFREWPSDDPARMADGLGALDAFLAEVDLEAPVIDRSWATAPLEEEDVAGLERPDRDVAALVGVSVAGASAWPIEDHAALQTESDQTVTEPSASRYERTVLEGARDCFVDGACSLETRNDGRRENLLMAVDFVLWKNMCWFDIGIDGDRRAIAARSWFKEPFEGDGGDTTLWQSYAVDIWLEQPDGGVRRYQALWSESELAYEASDELIQGTLKLGTDDIFRAADRAIAATR
jgi:hypothetical protein